MSDSMHGSVHSRRAGRRLSRSPVALTLTTAAALLGATLDAAPTAAQMYAPFAATTTEAAEAPLQREIARLAERAGGTVGVAAIHLESGREVYLNPDERFPMASTYKVPIAVQLFTRVDRGEVSLDEMVALEPGDLHPGSGTLTELFDDPGVEVSLLNLTELMLLISDNSATDLVLEAAGGPRAVTERMHALELGSGVRVDRPTVELIADWVGVRDLPPEDQLSPERFDSLYRTVSEAERERAAAAFDRDPRDTATPAAMSSLLTMIWRGEGLSEASSRQLLDMMRRCMTGDARLKGLLPSETVVYHKTGTIGGTTNDVGIIELPHDAGHVVTVVFVKESDREIAQRERAIAEIARAVHDYFLFTPATSASD